MSRNSFQRNTAKIQTDYRLKAIITVLFKIEKDKKKPK